MESPGRRECSAKEGIPNLDSDVVCPLFARPDTELQRVAENRKSRWCLNCSNNDNSLHLILTQHHAVENNIPVPSHRDRVRIPDFAIHRKVSFRQTSPQGSIYRLRARALALDIRTSSEKPIFPARNQFVLSPAFSPNFVPRPA